MCTKHIKCVWEGWEIVVVPGNLMCSIYFKGFDLFKFNKLSLLTPFTKIETLHIKSFFNLPPIVSHSIIFHMHNIYERFTHMCGGKWKRLAELYVSIRLGANIVGGLKKGLIETKWDPMYVCNDIWRQFNKF
jgi:hypothetical protein